MHRPIHFEIHAPDPAPVIEFYKKTLGWKFHKWDGPLDYWFVETGDPAAPGINGGVMNSRDGQPRTVNTISVKDVDAAVMAAVAAGGMNVVPKMAIPGVGWLAYCTDPGGNIYGMMHDDKNAK